MRSDIGVFLLVLGLVVCCSQLTTAWQQQQQQESRRIFCAKWTTHMAGVCFWGTTSLEQANAAAAAPPSSSTGSPSDINEWFLQNLQPATEDRPAIPLPSVTPKDQKTQPAVQGVIYGPSTIPPFMRSTSSYLLVEILKQEENQQPSSYDTLDFSTVVQSAKIPMTQVGSFPFQFQFTKLSKSVPSSEELMVRTTLVLDLQTQLDGVNSAQSQSSSSSLLCSYLTGQGIAKALVLPAAINNKKSTATTGDDRAEAGVFVRGPASVRLEPVPSGDNLPIPSCSAQ